MNFSFIVLTNFYFYHCSYTLFFLPPQRKKSTLTLAAYTLKCFILIENENQPYSFPELRNQIALTKIKIGLDLYKLTFDWDELQIIFLIWKYGSNKVLSARVLLHHIDNIDVSNEYFTSFNNVHGMYNIHLSLQLLMNNKDHRNASYDLTRHRYKRYSNGIYKRKKQEEKITLNVDKDVQTNEMKTQLLCRLKRSGKW